MRDPLVSEPSIQIGELQIGNDLPFGVICGPCQIESRDHSMKMAEALTKAARTVGRKIIFKASFDKANRTSLSAARGVGIDAGLKILQEVKETFGCPVLTDVHEPNQCSAVAQVADVLQIPAFLCRQTDLLVAAARTGAALNIKKGQFLAPQDMWAVAQKVTGSGNTRVMLCERGTSFGYNTLVNDFRALPIMAQTGCPVVFDATHSVQHPGGLGTASGGDRGFVAPLARAAIAVGCAALFTEVHDDPDNAPSDGPNMISLDSFANLLVKLDRLEQSLM